MHVTRSRLTFEDLLAIRNRLELRSVLHAAQIALSIPEANRLAAHALEVEPVNHALRLGIVHTYTSELLNPWLQLSGALHGTTVDTYHAPYGLAISEARAESPLVTHRPDVTVLMLRREDLHPGLSKPLAAYNSEQQLDLASEALASVKQIVGLFRDHRVGQLVLTLLPADRSPALGLFELQAERSEVLWWGGLKGRIGACLRECFPSSLFLDLDLVLEQVGRRGFFDRRLWYSAKYPFSTEASREVARQIVAVGVVLQRPKAKAIILDADNTLWGGIIGEDGPHGIALGPEYPGNTFVEFQRRLLDFQQRGVVLALCSKNNPEDVAQVISEHPHQVLRENHFAARRVNWLTKVENIKSLADELNLGLDSFIFVDDSDHECAAVRHELPQVEVIQTPGRPVEVPYCLDHIARLEVLSLTDEDLVKTEMYAQERKRREFGADIGKQAGDASEYLSMLKMKMRISLNAETHLARLSQLTQKTNQFNLTTRRCTEQEIRACLVDDCWVVADFALTDVFGDSGIVGLAIFHFESPTEVYMDNFLMSCRVIGRGAESAFLNALLAYLAERGVNNVVAEYRPTPKNILAQNFLSSHGFMQRDDGRCVRYLGSDPTSATNALPIAVEWAKEDDRSA